MIDAETGLQRQMVNATNFAITNSLVTVNFLSSTLISGFRRYQLTLADGALFDTASSPVRFGYAYFSRVCVCI